LPTFRNNIGDFSEFVSPIMFANNRPISPNRPRAQSFSTSETEILDDPFVSILYRIQALLQSGLVAAQNTNRGDMGIGEQELIR
jgi:hypothetical protein